MSGVLKLYKAGPLQTMAQSFWNAMIVSELKNSGYDVVTSQFESDGNVSELRLFMEDTKEILNTNILLADLDEITNYSEIGAGCGIIWTLKTQINDLDYKGIIGYYSKPVSSYVTELIKDVGLIVQINIPKDSINVEDYQKEAKKIVEAVNKIAAS